MKTRQLIAISFLIIATVLGIIFFLDITYWPTYPQDYFKREFYIQFGPLAICVELFIAGIQLMIGHSKANFTLALFAFTALLDPTLKIFGLFTNVIPLYAAICLLACAVIALWLALSNKLGLKKISYPALLGSFYFWINNRAIF